MKTSNRVGYELLDDNLKSLINASAKIFPISQADLDSNLNPNNYEFVKLQTVNITYIYSWTGVWSMIGAEDKSVDFNTEVINKPLTFPPTVHAHVKADITDFPVIPAAFSGVYSDLTGKPTIPTDTNQLAKTDVYTKAEITTSLSGKSDTAHDHDGRYNLKSEITSFLSGKSDTTHNHDTTYAVKSIEGTVSTNSGLITGLRTDVNTNTGKISTIQTNMANGDMHSNIGILNTLTQLLLDGWNSAVTHISDAVKHITGAERTSWNAKSNFSGIYTDLTSKPTIPTTTSQLTNDSTFQTALNVTNSISGKADKSYVDIQDATKVDSTTFTGHTGNTTVHVLQMDKDGWNAKQTALGFTPVNTTDGRLSDARTPLTHTHVKANITDFPTIPTALSQLSADTTHAFVTDADHTAWDLKTQIVQGTIEPVATAYWFKEV